MFRNVEIFKFYFFKQKLVKERIVFVEMKISKLINYSTNMCWSCLGTMVFIKILVPWFFFHSHSIFNQSWMDPCRECYEMALKWQLHNCPQNHLKMMNIFWMKFSWLQECSIRTLWDYKAVLWVVNIGFWCMNIWRTETSIKSYLVVVHPSLLKPFWFEEFF